MKSVNKVWVLNPSFIVIVVFEKSFYAYKTRKERKKKCGVIFHGKVFSSFVIK